MSLLCFALALFRNDVFLARACAWLLIHVFLGFLGSFLVHEVAHWVAFRYLCHGVEEIRIESSIVRFSLVPRGWMTGYQIVVVALAGPLASLVVGWALLAVPATYGIEWWYLAHVAFLCPVFGDGMAVCVGAKARGGRVWLP